MLEDSSNMEFKAFNIRGNHNQEVRSGYNQCDMSKLIGEKNGVTITYNDEENALILNGTCTANNTSFVFDKLIDNVKNLTTLYLYYISGEISTNEEFNLQNVLAFRLYDANRQNNVAVLINESISTNPLNKTTSNLENQQMGSFALNINQGVIFNNYTIRLMIANNTNAEYEKYGATPSVEIPSEIETTGENGTINETVCNKNYFDKNSVFTTSNHQFNGKTGEIQQSGGPEWKALETYIPVKELTKYTLSGNIMLRSWTIAIWFYDSNKVGISKFNKNETSTYKFTTPKRTRYVRFSANTSVLDASTIQLEEGAKATDYTAHEEQNITMPCQQPMVDEEDYFDLENEKEVHSWAKYIFTGQETFELLSSILEGTSRFVVDLATVFNSEKSNDTNIYTYSNFFKGTSWVDIYSINKTDKDLIANYNDGNYLERHRIVIRIDNNTASTLEEFKAWLAEKYTAGNPVYVWYKLATAIELPFTTEQKAVKEQIKNLHSYKNVTHIFSTDEVGANVEATYYKDLGTIINNNKQETETRLEAIETLLSTTQTSAMLLDNYQTDLESEVE